RAVPQFLQPFFDQGRLADARLSRNTKQDRRAGVRRFEGLPQSVALDLAPDGFSSINLLRLDTDQFHSRARLPSESRADFCGRGSEARVLFEHLQDESFEVG